MKTHRALRAAALAAGLLASLAVAGAEPDDEGRSGAPEQNEVLAVVDGEPIRREDVVGALAFQIYRHEVDIYSLLESEVERRIEARLLAREAARRGQSVEAMLAEVAGAPGAVDEAAVDRYLAEHPPDAKGADPGEVRARVRHYLGERGRIQRRIDFLAGLRESAEVRVLLEPPAPPRTDIDVGGAPARGPEDAEVTLVHFASFTSRASARSAARVDALFREFPGRIRWVHRSFLDRPDETGLFAARLAAEAEARGAFWSLHDRLFAANGALDEAGIVAAAREAGLEAEAIARARTDGSVLQRVKRDIDAARAAGAIREPTLFVNGRYVSGLSPDDTRAVVLEELAEH